MRDNSLTGSDPLLVDILVNSVVELSFDPEIMIELEANGGRLDSRCVTGDQALVLQMVASGNVARTCAHLDDVVS